MILKGRIIGYLKRRSTMNLNAQLVRSVQINTQELVWAIFGDKLPAESVVSEKECDLAWKEKYGPVASKTRIFWNFRQLDLLPKTTTIGTVVMSFKLDKAEQPQAGSIEADFLSREEVLRQEGALLSELERMGLYIITNEDPFEWKLAYSLSGN